MKGYLQLVNPFLFAYPKFPVGRYQLNYLISLCFARHCRSGREL
jgi:hypothetical protein